MPTETSCHLIQLLVMLYTKVMLFASVGLLGAPFAVSTLLLLVIDIIPIISMTPVLTSFNPKDTRTGGAKTTKLSTFVKYYEQCKQFAVIIIS
jgi:hypothetical protein